MSLLIAHVTPDRALVAADTQSSSTLTSSPSERRESAKLLPLPHIAAAAAVMGNMDFLTPFAVAAMRGASFDEICDAIAHGMIDERSRELDAMASHEHFIVSDRQILAIAGFSEARGRMRLIVAARTSRVVGFIILSGRDIVMPVVLGTPDSPERIREIAAAQVAQTRRTIPHCPIGGHLILADITRDAMRIERTALP